MEISLPSFVTFSILLGIGLLCLFIAERNRAITVMIPVDHHHSDRDRHPKPKRQARRGPAGRQPAGRQSNNLRDSRHSFIVLRRKLSVMNRNIEEALNELHKILRDD